MAPEAVLAFRCECEHPLCRDFVVLSLAEYDGATTDSRAVVTLLHGDVDGRSVVERTSRFCIVEEARIPSQRRFLLRPLDRSVQTDHGQSPRS